MSLLGRLGLPFDAAPTGSLGDGVYAIRDGIVNLYVVVAGAMAIAIDAGQNPRRVARAWARQLARLPVRPDQVAAVFVTHADSDHVGALGLMP
ncbi:MAG: MBL fold metallo-hydrolase, partial [Chloroflexota bacterium]